MGNSYGFKGKGVDLSQGPPKRKSDVVRTRVVIETPLVPTGNAPPRSGWHSNVELLLNFMMSFLCTIFSWAFPCEDILRVPAAIETPLVPAENAPSSSGCHSNVVWFFLTYDELSLHSFFLGFPKLHVEVWFFFVFKNFVWVLTINLEPYNHDSLLSSQSIRRRRSSSDLNSQPTPSQPFPLATRVPECPQSFASFLVIHFHFAYFPVCLFK